MVMGNPPPFGQCPKVNGFFLRTSSISNFCHFRRPPISGVSKKASEQEVFNWLNDGKHLTPGQSITKVKDEQQKMFSFGVCFAMTIYNYLNKELSYYDKNEVTGVVPRPSFTTIGQGTMEIMIGRKIDGPPTGVQGTVSFQIKGTNKMIVVMYSLPWDHGLYSNWLAVGIFPLSSTVGFFDKMYYDTEKNFKRKEFYRDVSPVVYREDPEFEVSAQTGKGHKERINVKVYPKKIQMLAPNKKGGAPEVDSP